MENFNLENELKSLISKYAGKINFTTEDCIEWDLSVTGDDAIELLMEYSKLFNVNIEHFPFSDYFHDEGDYWLFAWRKLFKKRKKAKFTIQNLITGVQKGVLND